MRVNFRSFNFAVWGNIALVLLVIMGCSLPVDADLNEPDSGLPSQTTPETEDGEDGERSSDDDPETGSGEDEEQVPDDDPEIPETPETDDGKEDEQTPALGRVGIRIGGMAKTAEGVYPDLGGITKYRLDFSGKDGKTAESRYLTTDSELELTLDAGEWEIRAYGFLERGAGQPPVAVISGAARVIVPEGGAETILIIPDRPVTEDGEPGFLSWDITYPRDTVWGAVLAVSLKIDENNFVPYTYVDLTGAGNQKISLPPGTYRMESRFLAHHVSAGSSEIVHIYPGLETAGNHVEIDGTVFPVPREFTSTGELKTYLASLPTNTEADPYPIRMSGVDLASKEKTGETMRTLYDALVGHYVTLDLRECTGAELNSASTPVSINGRKNIVSLVLPESIIKINANGFSGCEALKSVVLPKVGSLDTSAFRNCGQLETVFAPELIEVLEAKGNDTSAFTGCTALTTLYFPRLVSLGKYALYGCERLTEAAFPNLRTVEGLAFKGCSALKALVLPAAEKIAKSSLEITALEYLVFGVNPPEFEASVFTKNADFFQTGVIYVPPDAVETYKNTGLPNWSALKELVKPLPGPIVR